MKNALACLLFSRFLGKWTAVLVGAVAGVVLCQANGPASIDLKLLIGPAATPSHINQATTVSVLITNRSDVDATGVTVELQVPPLSTYFLSSPPVIAAPFTVTWTNLNLVAHSTLTVTNQLLFKSAGTARINATVSAAEPDTNPEDNRASIAIPITYSLADQQSATLGYLATSVVYDEKRGDLLALATGGDFAGELIAIAPDSGLVKGHWNIGASPRQIVLGSNPDRAYALTDAGINMVVLDRNTITIQKAVPVGALGAEAEELYVDPGDSRQVVIRSRYHSDHDYLLVADGQYIGIEARGGTGFGFYTQHTFLGSFGTDKILSRYQVTSQGFVLYNSSNMATATNLVLSSGLLFSLDGYVFNPADAFKGSFMGGPGFPTFDPAHHIVYRVTRDPDLVKLIDQYARTVVRSQSFSNTDSSFPAVAIPAGGEYVALWTKTSDPGRPGSISVIRNLVARGAGATDVALRNHSSGGSNTRIGWTLAVENYGPLPARDCWIDI